MKLSSAMGGLVIWSGYVVESEVTAMGSLSVNAAEGWSELEYQTITYIPNQIPLRKSKQEAEEENERPKCRTFLPKRKSGLWPRSIECTVLIDIYYYDFTNTI